MLIVTIAAFCTAYYFVNIVQVAMRIKRVFKMNPSKRMKPFDCTQCLTVWFAVVLYFLPIEIAQFLAVVFGAGFLSIKIK